MEDRMEEVLQRVQFKFASIIGELCSEPLVLSQFAVWVDMRISEYKLKGSISLDCSGETPDPIWLKGITYALTQKLKHAQKEADSVLSLGKGIGIDRIRRPRAGGGQPSLVRNNSSGYTGNNQGIAIKDEPGEDNDVDVFPVDLYANSEKATESPGIGSKRKLPSSASVAQDSSVFPSTDDSPEINQPIHKLSRLSSAEAQAASAEPEHTSLLSIIGMDHSGQESGELTLQETDSDEISIILDNSSLQDVGTMQQGDSSLSQSSLQKNTSYATTGYGPEQCQQTEYHKIPHPSVNYESGVQASRLESLDRRRRSHILVFERWLRNSSSEGRPLEMIPPDLLDRYLAQFFLTIRTSHGEEFSYRSLLSMRTSLSRFLLDGGYPCNITTSTQFRNSQLALHAKYLRKKPHVEKTLDVVNSLQDKGSRS
ncbi:uncharacterized protein LOC135470590 isoform X4 [Liolophura sinensis]|uniref:uncharacterized protein LOC135470590 isoform X4 n=1 Tax=Liolophura sinensis TaxID=3198878 RepID=UPI0031594F6E